MDIHGELMGTAAALRCAAIALDACAGIDADESGSAARLLVRDVCERLERMAGEVDRSGAAA